MNILKLSLLTLLLFTAAHAQTKTPCSNPMAALPAEAKSKAMREQLFNALADPLRKWTPEQTALFKRVYKMADAVNYDGHPPDEAIQLQEEILKAFTKEDLKIFTFQYDESIGMRPVCSCSVGSSFNVSCGGECTAGLCTATEDGCGFVGFFGCTGMCAQR